MTQGWLQGEHHCSWTEERDKEPKENKVYLDNSLLKSIIVVPIEKGTSSNFIHTEMNIEHRIDI